MTTPTTTAEATATKPARRGRGRPKGSASRRIPGSVADKGLRDRQRTMASQSQLGWRVSEFAAAVGISVATLWRYIESGKIKAVKIGGVRLIPRIEAVRLGLLEEIQPTA